MLGQTTLIFAYSFSVFRYGEKVNWVCFFGSSLLILGVGILIVFKPVPALRELSKVSSNL